MKWTSDRLQILYYLIVERGWLYREVAVELGTTRSAISGKVRDLSLSGERFGFIKEPETPAQGASGQVVMHRWDGFGEPWSAASRAECTTYVEGFGQMRYGIGQNLWG